MGHVIETFLVALLGAMRNLSDEALPILGRSWSHIFRVVKLAALPEVLALFAWPYCLSSL